MSGCSIHHFRTIDRPFTDAERQEIDSWSSRFSPSAYEVKYIYHYGSFKKKVSQVFPKYFDAMLHVNNWGEKQLMFRFPKDLVDWNTLTQYTNIRDYERHLDFRIVRDHIIMDLYWNEEEGEGWIEEDDYTVDRLVTLRDEILNGDYRTLFLGWLMVQQNGEGWRYDEIYDEDEDEDEDWDDDDEYSSMPPIPANLQKLTAAHQYLIDIFEMDEHLVKIAAQASPNARKQQTDYRKLISSLSNQEKEQFLLDFITDERKTALKFKQHLDKLNGGKPTFAFNDTLSWGKLVEKALQ